MKFTDTEEQQTIIREVNEEGKLVEVCFKVNTFNLTLLINFILKDLEMNGVKAKRIFKRRI